MNDVTSMLVCSAFTSTILVAYWSGRVVAFVLIDSAARVARVIATRADLSPLPTAPAARIAVHAGKHRAPTRLRGTARLASARLRETTPAAA